MAIGYGIGGAPSEEQSMITGTTTITNTKQTTLMKTITKTVSPSTITMTVTTQQQESDSTEWASTMYDIATDMSNIFSELSTKSDAFSKGKISYTEYLSYVQDSKYELEDLVEIAIEQQPPQEYLKAHISTVKGLNLAYSAFLVLEDGLIHDDASLIEEAAILLDLSTDEIEFASRLIELQK